MKIVMYNLYFLMYRGIHRGRPVPARVSRRTAYTVIQGHTVDTAIQHIHYTPSYSIPLALGKCGVSRLKWRYTFNGMDMKDGYNRRWRLSAKSGKPHVHFCFDP